MIFTFAFAYKEYFCLNCHGKGEFLGGAVYVEETPELKAAFKVAYDVWKAIYKHFLPRSQFGKSGCKKCKTSRDHREHLTQSEIMRDKYATGILENTKGFFKKQE